MLGRIDVLCGSGRVTTDACVLSHATQLVRFYGVGRGRNVGDISVKSDPLDSQAPQHASRGRRSLLRQRGLISAYRRQWSSILVRSYPGRTQADAAAVYAEEAALLAQAGYQPVTQSWGEGRAGVARTAAIELYANVLRPRGFLTVAYARSGVSRPPSASRATKRCPDCAEEVLAGAKICRFCRHEFSTQEQEGG